MAESVSPAVVLAMEHLYAVDPDGFLTERKRLAGEAKSAGDRAAYEEIGRLRKPSVAGWAVNLVARRAPDDLATLLRVGERLRDAQSRLDMATLQALRPDRDRAVDGFVSVAVQVVADHGPELRSAAQQEVRDTAIAAIADARAAAVVASGQVVKALSYSGFGEVDLSDAIARSSSGAILTVIEGRSPGHPAADDAAAAVARAAAARLEAEQTAAARAERIAGAEAALAEAERSLADAETAMTEARRQVKAAAHAREAAVKELGAARRA